MGNYYKGGVAGKRRSSYPADLLALFHFDSSFTADYVRDGHDGIVDTENGTPTIDTNAPKFGTGNLLLNDTESLEYDDTGLVSGLVQTGCISFWYKPGYSNAPSNHQFIYFSAASGETSNYLDIIHLSTGDLRFYLKTAASSNIFTIQASWLPTAGTWYHIEANYDITAGASRFFIDGQQHSTTATATGTRTNTTIFLRFGKTGSALICNFQVDEVQFYDAVQHTANFDVPTGPL